jgi:uncharacterized protein (TIGR02145 family)
MSGIFKGDSIYKSGGGGGGYKDGGQLVDGDFIEVQNNSVSSYENISRNTINFFLDPNSGEIINSVIELYTQINSNVCVYVLNNGVYLPLSYTGSNAINANDNYKVTIIGNSYTVEQETTVDEFVIEIGNQYLKAKKIGSLYWTLENYKTWWSVTDVNSFTPINGWRIPSNDDFVNLKNQLDPDAGYKMKSTSGWYNSGNGSNESGFNALPLGRLNSGGSVVEDTQNAYFVTTTNSGDGKRYYACRYNSNNLDYYFMSSSEKMNVRLCKDI